MIFLQSFSLNSVLCLPIKHDPIYYTAEFKHLKVEWTYFETLHRLQKEEGLHLDNKLRRNHVKRWHQNMNDRLGAQTLNRSVADALLFCKELLPNDFDSCQVTVDFLLKVDKYANY